MTANFVNILMGGVFHAAILFLVAAGLQVVFGVQKIFNLACGSFYALGAYSHPIKVRDQDAIENRAHSQLTKPFTRHPFSSSGNVVRLMGNRQDLKGLSTFSPLLLGERGATKATARGMAGFGASSRRVASTRSRGRGCRRREAASGDRPELRIIDTAQWDAVQTRLAQVAETFGGHRPPTQAYSPYLLSGLLEWLRGLDLNQRPLGYEGKLTRDPGRQGPRNTRKTGFAAAFDIA